MLLLAPGQHWQCFCKQHESLCLEALHQWGASDRHHSYLCLLLFPPTIAQRQTSDTFTGHPLLGWGLMSLRKNKCPAWEWGQQVLFPKDAVWDNGLFPILPPMHQTSPTFFWCARSLRENLLHCSANAESREATAGDFATLCNSGLSIPLAQSHFTHNKLCLCHFTACSPEIHSSGNLHICAWLQQIKLWLQVSGQSVFPAMFSRNFLPLPSPNTSEAFAKYSFLAFDNLSFRFFLPTKGFLGRLTDITSPSFQNRPDAGVMGWELCLP